MHCATYVRLPHFGSGFSSSVPSMSLAANPWEVGVPERSRRARSLLMQAALGAPTMGERDWRNCQTQARWRPRRGRRREPPGISSHRHSQSSGAQKQDRRRHRHRSSGEHRAPSCEGFEKQTLLHFTSSPFHHLTMSHHAPNHSRF